VAARCGEFELLTDQSPEYGGQGAAPEPFTLFLASLAACAGFYAMAFCQARDISTEGLKLVQRTISDPEGKRLVRIEQEIIPPPHFPAKYDKALARTAGQCTVKKVIMNPPEIVTTTVRE